MNVAQRCRLEKEKPKYESYFRREAVRRAFSSTLCACGCGGFTKRGRGVLPNKYIRGHATVGKQMPRGKDAPQFKGGRRVNQSGYVICLRPEHPRASHRYVAEHILVAEQALGRFLDRKHPVHHVDENRSNNVGRNLVICENDAYHHLLHRRSRALAACGNPSYRPCGFCSEHDALDAMEPWGTHGGYVHRACARAYQQNWRKQRAAQ